MKDKKINLVKISKAANRMAFSLTSKNRYLINLQISAFHYL